MEWEQQRAVQRALDQELEGKGDSVAASLTSHRSLRDC